MLTAIREKKKEPGGGEGGKVEGGGKGGGEGREGGRGGGESYLDVLTYQLPITLS